MRFIKSVFKVGLAGVTAVAVLSIIMCFYSLTPLHIPNENGNTDYVWQPGSVWTKATEGISWGKNDEAGYNNAHVIENPDIIVVGSSHMEGHNVLQKENAAYLLGEMLKDSYSVYNLGVAGHHFFKVSQYLPKNAELYSPKAIIVETDDVEITDEDVKNVIEHTVEFTQSHNTGIISMLQRVPFIRQVYYQFEDGMTDILLDGLAAKKSDSNVDAEEFHPDMTAYSELFEYYADTEKKYNTEIIIIYHPTETVNADGTVSYSEGEGLTAFAEAAEKNGITFVDLTQSFADMYNNEHHFAHGFATGKTASGHLNRYGHKAFADAAYGAITELEKEGKICR